MVARWTGGEVWLTDWNGEHERRLNRGPWHLRAWFPDARSLLIEGNDGVFYRLRVNGAPAKHLVTPDSFASSGGVSPDGRFLVYSHDVDDSGVTGIYIAAVGTDTETRIEIQSEAANADMPDWQPLCTITGTEGNDRIIGRPGPDKICGLGGNDIIFGHAGNDSIIGGPGDDCIDGGAGNDWLFGAAGNDTIVGRYGGRDIVDGGPGTNRASYDPNIDTVRERGARLRGRQALNACELPKRPLASDTRP